MAVKTAARKATIVARQNGNLDALLDLDAKIEMNKRKITLKEQEIALATLDKELKKIGVRR